MKILVVDDNPANLLVVRRVLAKLDVELIEARGGNEALRATLDHEFALILLDVYMPDINGFEVAEILSQEDATRQTPIIFITATYADDVHRLKGYGFGAVDYMAKPLEATILLSKVQVFLELHRNKMALRQALEELSERNRQLEEELKHRREMEDSMRHLAMHDALTSLPNRLLFMDRLQMAHERARRYRSGFALAYMDVDRFKQINDQWGHAAGDEVLKALARRLNHSLRASDTAARLGGDEFALVVESPDDFAELTARMEETRILLEHPVEFVRGDEVVVVPFTVSIGMALYPTDSQEIEELLHVADSAMYRSKRARGQVQ